MNKTQILSTATLMAAATTSLISSTALAAAHRCVQGVHGVHGVHGVQVSNGSSTERFCKGARAKVNGVRAKILFMDSKKQAHLKDENGLIHVAPLSEVFLELKSLDWAKPGLTVHHKDQISYFGELGPQLIILEIFSDKTITVARKLGGVFFLNDSLDQFLTEREAHLVARERVERWQHQMMEQQRNAWCTQPQC